MINSLISLSFVVCFSVVFFKNLQNFLVVFVACFYQLTVQHLGKPSSLPCCFLMYQFSKPGIFHFACVHSFFICDLLNQVICSCPSPLNPFFFFRSLIHFQCFIQAEMVLHSSFSAILSFKTSLYLGLKLRISQLLCSSIYISSNFQMCCKTFWSLFSFFTSHSNSYLLIDVFLMGIIKFFQFLQHVLATSWLFLSYIPEELNLLWDLQALIYFFFSSVSHELLGVLYLFHLAPSMIFLLVLLKLKTLSSKT